MARIKRKIAPFLAALLALSALFPSLPARAALYRKGNTEKKQIALSFDDGPSKQNTEEILSILAEYGVKATFFVIGKNAAGDPDRIRSIFDAGHELGNHTYTHAYISKLSSDKIREEVQMTEDVLVEITGQKPKIFRPPGGYYDDASLSVVEEMGYESILWSLDTRDWSMPKSDKIVSKIEGSASEGDIILFHDLDDKRLPTPAALRKIIPYLIDNGYEIITVSELLTHTGN